MNNNPYITKELYKGIVTKLLEEPKTNQQVIIKEKTHTLVVGNETIFNAFQAFFTKKLKSKLGFSSQDIIIIERRRDQLYQKLLNRGQHELVTITTQNTITIFEKDPLPNSQSGYVEKEINIPQTQEINRLITISEEEIAALIIYSLETNNKSKYETAITALGRPKQTIEYLIQVAKLR
ncbi:4893_t:CDS:2 [Racocetra fulgida]|uniref:4893_t:CDS:1 n=1 Tax=Racocetra fulgida TaxID=60492 RepID=A0A9N9ES57_9GLOM|nr:4893_t:CDS:2 [Racocetra fulgida]